MAKSDVVDDLDVSMYQEIVDNARVATQSRLVHMSRYYPETRRVQVVASSNLGLPAIQRAQQQIRRFYPDFQLTKVSANVSVNRLNEQVYLEGEMVSATVEEMSEGVLNRHIVALGKRFIGINYIFCCPLLLGGEVYGALTFHHETPMTESQQATCQAFVRQVGLTVENAYLLRLSREHVSELERSRIILTKSEEGLRRKVAEFMHGQVQTRLLLAWHRLVELEDVLMSDTDRARALLCECRELLDEVREDDVRKASHLLHPTIIHLGLIPAIRSLADTFQSEIEVTVSVNESLHMWDDPIDNKIPETIRLAVYRVVEEALTNAYRHAEATSVEVHLGVTPADDLEVRVTDNGRGFNPRKMRQGLGLGSIDARLAQMHGRWHLKNNKEAGATLLARVPLQLHHVDEVI